MKTYDENFGEIRARLQDPPSCEVFTDVLAHFKRVYEDSDTHQRACEELLPYMLKELEGWGAAHRACTPHSWAVRLAAQPEHAFRLGPLFRRLIVYGADPTRYVPSETSPLPGGGRPHAHVSHDEQRRRDDVIRDFIASAMFDHIELLEFRGGVVSTRMFEGLRRQPRRLALRTLIFEGCHVHDGVLRLLEHIGVLDELERLELNVRAPTIAEQLEEASQLGDLTTLAVRNFALDDSALRLLGDLPCADTLEHLELRGGVSRLYGLDGDEIRLPALETLDLSRRYWDMNQLDLLFGRLDVPSLERLVLRGCTIEEPALWVLRSVIVRFGITHMDLTEARLHRDDRVAADALRLASFFLESLPEHVEVEGLPAISRQARLRSAGRQAAWRMTPAVIDEDTLNALDLMHS